MAHFVRFDRRVRPGLRVGADWSPGAKVSATVGFRLRAGEQIFQRNQNDLMRGRPALCAGNR